jgi:uncharacterized protein YqgC (DUF456 family)
MQIIIGLGLALVNLLLLVTVIFGLPGIWLMVLATSLVAWWQWDHNMISWGTLVAICIISLVAEAVELLAGLLGAARAGGGWLASLGALAGGLLGAVVGTMFFPLLGTLIGACVGAGMGAFLMHRWTARPQQAVKIGLAAGIGRLVGTIAKLSLGIAVWIIATVASFWP